MQEEEVEETLQVEAEVEVLTEVAAVAVAHMVETVEETPTVVIEEVEVLTEEIEKEAPTVEAEEGALTEVDLEETSQVSQLVVTNVETIVPFHLNQMEVNLCSVENVSVEQIVDHPQIILIENLHSEDSTINQKTDHVIDLQAQLQLDQA